MAKSKKQLRGRSGGGGLRICILVDTLGMGGAERVAVTSALGLSDLGHDVTLAAYHSHNAFGSLLNDSAVKVEIASVTNIRRALWLRRVVVQGRFDVVHAIKAPALVWGLLGNIDVPRGIWIGGHHSLTREAPAVRWLSRVFAGRISGWVVPSRAAVEVARKEYLVNKGNVFVVPNPVDCSRFLSLPSRCAAIHSLGLREENRVVTMIANLHPWKNYDMFLRIAQRLAALHPNLMFLSVGRDTMNGAIQAKCAQLGLGERVRFLGHCDDIPTVLAATDVAVITSEQESFCLALAEAGAAGVPCVSTRNGGAEEVLLDGKTGRLVSCGDDVCFASHISELIDDPDRRRAMGRAAKEHVAREFSVAKCADRLYAIYKRAINRL